MAHGCGQPGMRRGDLPSGGRCWRAWRSDVPLSTSDGVAVGRTSVDWGAPHTPSVVTPGIVSERRLQHQQPTGHDGVGSRPGNE